MGTVGERFLPHPPRPPTLPPCPGVLEDISQEKRMKTTMSRYLIPHVDKQVMALGEDGLMVSARK